ncbi:Ig-like domain-containing protein [Corynebacterium axilliensis]|uniref:L,D-transpeptidase n=2 Tax=unclassified Corynebacterium TaxID=2624378 RepID=UPI0038D007DE
MQSFFPSARPAVTLSLLALLTSMTTACTIGASEGQEGGAQPDASVEASASASAAAEKAKKAEELKFSVKDGAKDVDPSEPIKVTSTAGLKDVTMTNEVGTVVQEKLSDDEKTWTTAEELGYNHTYTIDATDKDGVHKTMTFSTPQAAAVSDVALSPLPGSEVGVGQVIGVRFGNYVTDRKAAEEAITVKTEPAVEGAFYWVNNQEVRWRPKDFWQPGTKVSVDVDLYGRDLGGGAYGGEDASTNFTVGERVIALIDNNTKMMSVFKNGEVLRRVPVSMGTDGKWDTPNGTYVIGDEYPTLTMDSTTFGLSLAAGGYRTNVNWATQMSYSGIYVHSAPWAAGALGSYNQSHGCINVMPEVAEWFQNTVKRGDVVKVSNTGGETLNPLDGLGDWNMDWATWSAGNATANQ